MDEQELTAAEAEDAGFVAEAVDPVEEALAKAVEEARALPPERPDLYGDGHAADHIADLLATLRTS